MRPFLPTPRQTNWLILLGFSAFAAALYVRYALLEFETLIAMCATGTTLAACGVRRFVIELAELNFFGGGALVAAALHFWRPRVATLAIALAGVSAGLLWGNPGSSAVAAAILTLAFARPQAGRRTPATPTPPPATAPASSRTIH